MTAALLALVAVQVDWRLALDRLQEGRWEWFAAAVGLLVGALLLGAIRWHVLLRAAQVTTTGAQTLRAYAIGVFSNNFLPTGFGGDAARAWLVGRSGTPLIRALTSVVVDRVSGLACLIALAWVAVAAEPSAVPGELELALVAVTAGGAAAVVLGAVGFRVGGPAGRFLPQRVRAWLGDSRSTLASYGADRRAIVATIWLGLAYQALIVLSMACLARAIQLDVALAVLTVTVPLVLILTAIPISVAGFGVREAGFVVLLAEVDVAATDATLLSLMSVVALAASSLPGGIAILFSGERPAAPGA